MYDASVRIVYNAQGEQYPATLVDMTQPHDMNDHLCWLTCYVMLSRAESLEGLLITRLCDRALLDKGPPRYLVEEVERLRNLERQSHSALQQYLQTACSHLPPGDSEFVSR